MRRIVISLLVGALIAIGTPVAVALVLYRGDSEAIVPFVLYWPLTVTDRLGFGLDCGNANLISEKLTCVRTALLIDVFLYPAMICVFAYIARRMLGRAARLRLPHVA
jgi:hypothetical protein